MMLDCWTLVIILSSISVFLFICVIILLSLLIHTSRNRRKRKSWARSNLQEVGKDFSTFEIDIPQAPTARNVKRDIINEATDNNDHVYDSINEARRAKNLLSARDSMVVVLKRKKAKRKNKSVTFRSRHVSVISDAMAHGIVSRDISIGPALPRRTPSCQSSSNPRQVASQSTTQSENHLPLINDQRNDSQIYLSTHLRQTQEHAPSNTDGEDCTYVPPSTFSNPPSTSVYDVPQMVNDSVSDLFLSCDDCDEDELYDQQCAVKEMLVKNKKYGVNTLLGSVYTEIGNVVIKSKDGVFENHLETSSKEAPRHDDQQSVDMDFNPETMPDPENPSISKTELDNQTYNNMENSNSKPKQKLTKAVAESKQNTSSGSPKLQTTVSSETKSDFPVLPTKLHEKSRALGVVTSVPISAPTDPNIHKTMDSKCGKKKLKADDQIYHEIDNSRMKTKLTKATSTVPDTKGTKLNTSLDSSKLHSNLPSNTDSYFPKLPRKLHHKSRTIRFGTDEDFPEVNKMDGNCTEDIECYDSLPTPKSITAKLRFFNSNSKSQMLPTTKIDGEQDELKTDSKLTVKKSESVTESGDAASSSHEEVKPSLSDIHRVQERLDMTDSDAPSPIPTPPILRRPSNVSLLEGDVHAVREGDITDSMLFHDGHNDKAAFAF